MPGALLRCPVRGALTVPERAANGLTFTEEKRRIDCIELLRRKGYPLSHIKVETTLWRFGSQGRNSFRTDIAVFDQPVESLSNDLKELSPHIVLVAEIKRDNNKAGAAVETQVYPALNFLPKIDVLGIYWDDIEKRLFFREQVGGELSVQETPLANLPNWGQAFQQNPLLSTDLATTQLRQLFEKIEDRLHAEVSSKALRFEIMLQLLLVKLYDEYVHPTASNDQMDIQDFTNSPLGDQAVKSHLESILDRALLFYQPYLPGNVSRTLGCAGSVLRSLSALLAPVRFLNTRRDVVQDFYMYFASEVYKWDLGQYFTPTEVVDFIVELANPRAGEHVKDPACGSGDFLISAFQHAARQNRADLRDSVWGSDNSAEAVQVAILNMVLNGDGKSQIRSEDSLLHISDYTDRFSVVLCNPPFGQRINETRQEVLRQFDLGHVWKHNAAGILEKTDEVAKRQQMGLLFAELCIRQTAPGGRVGIILPNGYLGNRSAGYVAFREWLIRHARIAAITAFPRFTFKKSGADVSASAVFLEKRSTPLTYARDAESHPFYAGMVESVGWQVGNKRSKRVFKRDLETGAFLTDEDNEQIPDADFDRVAAEVRSQRVVSIFPWLSSNPIPDYQNGWSTDFAEVTAREDLSLDPKRWSERYHAARADVESGDHFRLRDVVGVIDEVGTPDDPSGVYDYVELQDASDGLVTPKRLRGWELPDRARHYVRVGDLFVGGVWGSVSKWFIAGGDCSHMMVSNGFVRLRPKPEHETYLVDIVAGLVSENYLIQARALCTGSDGLAELSGDDFGEILLPKVTDPVARQALQGIVDALLTGRATVGSVVMSLQSAGQVHPEPSNTRKGRHVVQV